MKCLNCDNLAKFVCLCQYIGFCASHVGFHMKDTGHVCEELNITLDQSESQSLKEELKSRLDQLDKARRQISNHSQSIIKQIKSYSQASLKYLNSISEFYLVLLNFNQLSTSLKLETDKVKETYLIVKKIFFDIKDIVEEGFFKNLVSIVEKKNLPEFDNEFKIDVKCSDRGVCEFTEVFEDQKAFREVKWLDDDERYRIENIKNLIDKEKFDNKNFFAKFRGGYSSQLLKEKLRFMESLRIEDYLAMFVEEKKTNMQVYEMKFTRDAKYSFVCNGHVGKI